MALLVGDKSPKAVRVTWTATDLDLRTVVALNTKVRWPGGGIVEWAWTFTSSETQLVATHVLADTGGDLPQVGDYVIFGELVLEDETRRAVGAVTFSVGAAPP